MVEDMKRQLLTLRKNYQERLKGEVEDLKVYYDALEQDRTDVKDDLLTLSHTLAGSGATYGFRNISTYAFRVEKAIEAEDFNDAKSHLYDLIDACIGAIKKEIRITGTSNGQSKAAKKSFDILLVDDSESVRDILQHTFKAAGCMVTTAPDGEKALAQMLQNKPDLAVFDRNMPGHEGFVIVDKMKEMPDLKDIPVVFLTAEDSSDDIMKGIEMGAVDYITKPFNPQEVVDICLDILNGDEIV